MNRRNLILGGVVAVLAVAGAWYFLGRSSSGVTAGAGPYETAMAECHEAVMDDTMHPEDLKFVPGTTYHQVRADQSVLLGGKFTRLNEFGNPKAWNYECLATGNRIINVDIR